MTPWTKRLAVLLAISVGLNLLLAGFWVGRRFGGPRGRPHGPDPIASISEGGERRHPALRAALERHRNDFRDRRDGVRKARIAAREALARPDFDRAALERALAELRSETAKSQELTHRALLEAAEKAKPEQRRALGRALGPGGRDK